MRQQLFRSGWCVDAKLLRLKCACGVGGGGVGDNACGKFEEATEEDNGANSSFGLGEWSAQTAVKVLSDGGWCEACGPHGGPLQYGLWSRWGSVYSENV